jgi:hypothetical protein
MIKCENNVAITHGEPASDVVLSTCLSSDAMLPSYALHVEKYPNYSILFSLIPCVGHSLAPGVQINVINDSRSKILLEGPG